MIISLPYILLVYFLPGFLLSRGANFNQKNNPLVWLFISLAVNPVGLTLTGLVLKNTPLSFLVYLVILLLLALLLKSAVHLPETNLRKIDLASIALLLVFLYFVNQARIGVFKGHNVSISDDLANLSKVTAVAVTGVPPQHYDYPFAPLSYYYFGYVNSGLLVNLSNNLVRANQAWAIHVFLQTFTSLAVLFYFAALFFKSFLARFAFLFSFTFYSGLEYYLFKYLYLTHQIGYQDHLEWWTRWFPPMKEAVLQISSPYVLYTWVPQQIFAVFIFLILFLVAFKKIVIENRALGVVIQALLLASIFGHSGFIALSIFPIFFIFYFWGSLKRGSGELVGFFSTLVFSVILLGYNFYLTLGKENILSFKPNLFPFLSLKNAFLNFLLNFLLTVGAVLLVDFGPIIFMTLIALIILRLKAKKSGQSDWLPSLSEKPFWLALLLLPLLSIFFIRSYNTNDYSMRAVIPSQLALAVVVAAIADQLIIRKKKLVVLLFLTPLFLSSLNTFHENKNLKWLRAPLWPIYGYIENRTPLKSLILTDLPFMVGNIPTYAHRLTLTDVDNFTGLDKQYTRYLKLDQKKKFLATETDQEICESKGRIEKELNGYRFYFLTKKSYPWPLTAQDNDLNLYEIKCSNLSFQRKLESIKIPDQDPSDGSSPE